MSKTAERKKAYKESIGRAVDWLVSKQHDDGGFEPIVSMSHYMAMGAALCYLGRPYETARLMPFLKKRFVKDDGDFDMPEINAGKLGSMQECRYAPAWMIISAHVNAEYDVSLPAMPHLMKFQEPKSGGF